MVTGKNNSVKKLPEEQLNTLIDGMTKWLKADAKKNKDKYKKMSAERVELKVLDALKAYSKGNALFQDMKFKRVPNQHFPDIIPISNKRSSVNNQGYEKPAYDFGIEVKSTKKDKWKVLTTSQA